MEAKKLSGALSDPTTGSWSEAPVEHVAMASAPLADQQSRYIRSSRADQPYGLVRDLRAQAAHDGESIFLRLEWSSPTLAARANGENPLAGALEGPDAFPDAVAVMFPANGEARLESKGSSEAPVAIWRWAEGKPEAVENLVASGLGTLCSDGASNGLHAQSGSDGPRWQVVFSRPLAGGPDSPPELAPGQTVQIAFAVWAGANQERAGIKSYSQRWIDLALE